MNIADMLKSARLQAGMTQEQVALKAEMHTTQYNAYEKGRSRPSPATLARISKALSVTVDELLTDAKSLATADEDDSRDRLDWDEARAALQYLTAERLGIEAARVVVEVRLT